MKKLTAKDVFTKEAYDSLSAQERREILKVEQAKEYSSWRSYPDICSALVARIPEDWWGRYTAEHIGEIMSLLKTAFDDGKNA